jgi:hypothetical protein
MIHYFNIIEQCYTKFFPKVQVCFIFTEMQEKAAYIRPKVVGPCASGRYVHRAALYMYASSLYESHKY